MPTSTSLFRRIGFYSGLVATHSGLAVAGLCVIGLTVGSLDYPADTLKSLFGTGLIVAATGMAAMDLAVRLPRLLDRFA